jgi:hypothetical protein
MITLDEFVGALLAGVTRGRALSDSASAQVAQQYAEHDLLKGFPIPRMTIQHLDAELTFAVASKLGAAAALVDAELQKNATYRLSQMLSALPEEPVLQEYLGNNAESGAAWRKGLDGFALRLGTVLAQPATNLDEVLSALTVTIVNYVYESTDTVARAKLFGGRASNGELARGSADALSAFIEARVRAVLAPIMPTQRPDSDSRLAILVSASELEGLNPAVLHKAKVTIAPSDRRWIEIEQNGVKVKVLDRG